MGAQIQSQQRTRDCVTTAEKERVYSADKVWKAMKREQITIACRTVERLMHQMGLSGVIRGKAQPPR